MEQNKRKNNGDFDEFEDIFSASGADDFEDIFSDSKDGVHTANTDADEFEDIFSGRHDEDDAPAANDPYAGFFNDDAGFSGNMQEPASFHHTVNTTPEQKPYSYHYSDRDAKRTRARNGDEIYSGREAADKPARTKPKHLARKIIAGVLCAVLVFLIAAFGYGYSRVQRILDAVNYVPLGTNEYIASSELRSADSVQNILFIGVDAREGEDVQKTRSDTMMLVSIDTRNKQIKLTSFLRDMYVEIPGWRSDKLNAAHSHGGTQLLVDTLEYNFKVDIDNYMLVSFDMFTAIIDALGGVDVEITEREAEYINGGDHMDAAASAAFEGVTLQEGEVHFTGAQALWYSRIRYLDSDFFRTARQRKVISAVMRKAATTSPFTLLDMLEDVMPLVQTDLTTDELTDLGLHALSYLGYDIAQLQVPADGAYESARRRSQSVLIPDMDENTRLFQEFVFNRAEVEEETTQESE